MAVVYKIGRIPIKYHANICSYATIITILMYIFAIIIPYIIGGLTLNFFPKYDIRSERPEVTLIPEIEFNLTSDFDPIYFRLDNYKIDQNRQNFTRIPVIQFPHVSDKKFLKFTAYFPVKPTESIKNVNMSFKFTTEFTEAKRSFTSHVQIDEQSYEGASAIDIFGSLSYSQEMAINAVADKYYPLESNLIDQIAEIYDSFPTKRGQLDFIQRNVLWTYGPTTLFEIHFSMRIPILTIVRDRDGFFRFLDGWTTYIAIAVPIFLLTWRGLERFFGSGIIPIRNEVEVALNTEMIPKFNR